MIVYFSSKSEYTKKFVDKLDIENIRIPLSKDTLYVDKEYILCLPTYAGMHGEGSVPKHVIRFLNVQENRDLCRGVIATGNINFGITFCLAGDIVSKKLRAPLLGRVELAGTEEDVIRMREEYYKIF